MGLENGLKDNSLFLNMIFEAGLFLSKQQKENQIVFVQNFPLKTHKKMNGIMWVGGHVLLTKLSHVILQLLTDRFYLKNQTSTNLQYINK